MRHFDWGQAIQIVANLGVIAGIVFLAVQLHQNNELLELQVRSDGLARATSSADLVLGNPYLFEFLRQDPANLAPAERDAIVLLGIRALVNFQYAFEDAQQELRDEESLIQTVRAVWHRPHLNYGMPVAWPLFKDRARPDFVAWMEEKVIPPDP